MKTYLVVGPILILLLSFNAAATEAFDPEIVIQKEVAAYNNRDLDGFLATYHPEIKIFRFPDKLLYSGLEQMRSYYKELFEKAKDLHATIATRIVMGNTVIDHEKITGHTRAPNLEAVLIYKIKDGLIHRVWILSKPADN